MAIGACGGDEAAGVSVVDSAGVVIVRSSEPAWPAGEGWRLADAPDVMVPPEGEGYQLSGVHSAVRLRDGSIVVANGGENRLLFFDEDGRLVDAAGRFGGGPGEFRNLTHVWRIRGDTLVAFDWLGARISVWDGPELERMAALRSPDGVQVIAWGAFPDGSLLVSATPRIAPGAPIGLHRDSVPFFRFGPSGEPGDTVAILPFRETYRLELDGRRTSTDPPFGREFALAVAGDSVVYGAAVSRELEVRDRDGALVRILRLPGAPRPVTDADQALHRRDRIARDAGYGASRQETERLLDRLEFPAAMPAHGRALPDPDGRIWLEEYEPDEAASRSWSVLSPAGEYLGDVPTPPGFHALEIGSDYVLGRARDDLDRESILVYRLLTTPAP